MVLFLKYKFVSRVGVNINTDERSKMTRKTSFLLPFCVMVALSNAAYSAENYASEEYVDDLFFEVIDYVDSTTTPLNRTMRANDSQLFDNQVVLRDMLNGRDADDNWIQLDTEAKMAIPAINELHAEIAGKQDVINADNPLSVENVSGLSPVATSGSFNDLTDVPEFPSMDGVATKEYVDEELAKKVEADVVQTLQESIENNYLTKTEVQNTYVTQQQAADTYVTSQEVTQQITNVIGDDTTGLRKQVADNTTAIAGKVDTSALESAVAGLEEKIDNAVIDASNIDLSSYAKTADVEATYATKVSVESVDGRVETIEQAGYQTAVDVEDAITTATATLATKEELGSYAKTDDLGTLATKDSVSETEIDNKAVTLDKIAGVMPTNGETLLMSVDEAGNVTWLSVKILK